MLPSGSVEDRPSKKTYQKGMGYCGWKSNEATGGTPGGAAGVERLRIADPSNTRTWIAGADNGEATTSARQSNTSRPTCVRLRAIVAALLPRRALRGAARPPSSRPHERHITASRPRLGGQTPR